MKNTNSKIFAKVALLMVIVMIFSSLTIGLIMASNAQARRQNEIINKGIKVVNTQ